MNNPKILILGHARHGKDTVAELLRDKRCLKFASSSEAALDLIFPTLSELYGYKTHEEAFEDRINHRFVWFELIRLINAKDPTTLVKHILETNDVYVGLRSEIEYLASEYEFKYVLWVDASKRLPLENKNSFDIEYDERTMIYIDNNGSEENLEDEVDDFISTYL